MFPESAQAQEEEEQTEHEGPEFEIYMDSYEEEAEVALGCDGMVNFYGKIVCKFPDEPGMRQFCTLNLVTAISPWFISKPPCIYFKPDDAEQNISLTCMVPIRTPSFMVGYINVAGWWTYELWEKEGMKPVVTKVGNTRSIDLAVTVKPYVELTMTPWAYDRVETGEWGRFEIYMTNWGNCPTEVVLSAYTDTQIIEVRVHPGMESNVWLPANDTVTEMLVFEARVLEEWGLYSEVHEIHIVATCDIPSVNGPYETTLYLRTYERFPYPLQVCSMFALFEAFVLMIFVIVFTIFRNRMKKGRDLLARRMRRIP